jgi:hypothetical protein
MPSFRTLAALAALVVAAPAAGAQTSYSAQFSFAAGSAVAPGYLTFDAITGGEFRFHTVSVPGADPQVYLFEGTRAALGATLTGNDDGCRYSPELCPASVNPLDALFTSTLVGGRSYTLAIGDYPFTVDEARDGTMDSPDFSTQLVVSSETGTAANFVLTSGTPSSTVPEPGAWALLGTGLAGVLVATRRRRAA